MSELPSDTGDGRCHPKKRSRLVVHGWTGAWLAVFMWLMLACGGPSREEPTPIPADSVIPDQPTMVFPTYTPILPGPTLTPTPPPDPAQRPTPTWTPFALESRNQESDPFLDALAIPQQVIALRRTPGGEVMANIPSNQTLIAVARSENGRWLAVYAADGQSGWVDESQVNLYSDGLLPRTDTIPVRSGTSGLLNRADVEIGSIPLDPETRAMGTTIVDGLRIRGAPSTETGGILASLSFEEEVAVLGRSADGAWYQISLLGKPIGSTHASGWVSAQFVRLEDGSEPLPVVE